MHEKGSAAIWALPFFINIKMPQLQALLTEHQMLQGNSLQTI